jgi:3-dehydroquinate dehydratase
MDQNIEEQIKKLIEIKDKTINLLDVEVELYKKKLKEAYEINNSLSTLLVLYAEKEKLLEEVEKEKLYTPCLN